MQQKYQEIYLALKQEIAAGDYPYQTLLPSEHRLVQRFGCARNTVRRALAMLGTEGYVQAVHGKGVRVIYQPPPPANYRIEGVQSFSESARRNGQTPKTTVLDIAATTVDAELSQRTGFPAGTKVWRLERLRFLDHSPLILDLSYFSQAFLPSLSPAIAQTSVYAHMDHELGISIATARRIMTVERVTPRDLEVLAIQDFNCVAVVTTQGFDVSGAQVEYTQSRHRPDYFAFHDVATRNPSNTR